MTLLRPALQLAFAFLVVQPLLAQTDADIQIGMTPFNAFHSGKIDNVNLSNGNVSITIPLVSYPQRGGALRLNYELVYNGKSEALTHICTPSVPGVTVRCSWLWQAESGASSGEPNEPGSALGMGWRLVDDQAVVLQDVIQGTPGPGTETFEHEYVNFVTADGGLHDGAPVDATHQRALDGSGFINATTFSWTSGYTPTPCTSYCNLRDGNGVAYYPSPNVVREDTNGNQITLSSTTVIDTVGRQIPAMVPTTNYAGCTGPSPTSSAYLWQPPGFGGGTLSYKFCMATMVVNIPAGDGSAVASAGRGSYPVLQSVVLPNGQTWNFQYGSQNPGDNSSVNFGDIAQVTFPTGGTLNYTYQTFTVPNGPQGLPPNTSTWAVSRTENANDGTGKHTWAYSYGVNNASGTSPVTNVVTDPAGNATTHTFISAFLPYETAAVSYQGAASGNNILKQVTTAYSNYSAALPNAGDSLQGYFPQTITTALGPTTSQKLLTYGATFPMYGNNATGNYGLITASSIYDYGSGSPGALLRQEQTSYLFQSSAQYSNDNLLNLISSHTVQSAGGTTMSQQSFNYDEANYLATYGAVTQHGSPISLVRGNRSTTTEWLNTGTSPSSHTNWYDTGEVYQAVDPLGNVATSQYAPAYAGSLLTSMTNALGQSVGASYDFGTAVRTSATDLNGQVTTWSYDALARTVGVVGPQVFPGTGLQSQATICYDDTPGECTPSSPLDAVVITEAVNASTSLQQEQQVDGFGRKSLGRLLSDPSGITYTNTSYDNMGHVYQVWNPTRCNPISQSSCPGEATSGTTTHFYDALSRATMTVLPYGTERTVYSGNAETYWDEVSNQWTRVTDALGRLTEVLEPSPNAGGSSRETDYAYDALGNLIGATQKGTAGETARTRSFAYDSLSRLLWSTNPETGTVQYGYDADSNLASRTDARNVMTSYTYDALNRLTSKVYHDGKTASDFFQYDTSVMWGSNCGIPTSAEPCFNIGHLTHEFTSDFVAQSIFGYDAMGRVNFKSTCIDALCGTDQIDQHYLYDLAGNPTSSEFGYDCARALAWGGVASTYDGAGRLSVATNFYDTPGTNVAPSATNTLYAATSFDPVGPSGSYVVSGGTPYAEAMTRDMRLRQVSYSSPVYSWAITYTPNGNVASANDSVNGNWTQFGYDGMNRLVSGTSATRGAQWTYDSFGNRLTQIMTAGSGIQPQFTFSQPTNRPDNQCFDAAGNQLGITDCTQFTYDGAGRLASSNYGQTTYRYFPDGSRAAKYSNGAIENAYIYDLSGRNVTVLGSNFHAVQREAYVGGRHVGTFAGETSVVGSTPSSGAPLVLAFSDWLGTERARANSSASLCQTTTSLPFGDSSQTTGSCSPTSTFFTGKERDTESGLDYFGARYYNSNLGRWMSPDWSAQAEPVPYAKLDNPQSLNLYAYVQGNAESFTDHDGHKIPADSLWSGSGNGSSAAQSMIAASAQQALMDAVAYDLAEAAAKAAGTDQSQPAPAGGVQQQGVRDPRGNTVTDPNTHAPLASPVGSLQPVADAGKRFGNDLKTMMNTGGPDAFLSSMLAGLDHAVGHGGTFDYQRQTNADGSMTFVSAYRDVSNYNIGLFAQQSGISLQTVLGMAQGYASVLSKNYDATSPSGGNPRNAEMIRLGYAAGTSGAYGSGTTLP